MNYLGVEQFGLDFQFAIEHQVGGATTIMVLGDIGKSVDGLEQWKDLFWVRGGSTIDVVNGVESHRLSSPT